MCLHNSQRGGEEQVVLSLQSKYYAMILLVVMVMGDYFAIEADTMIDIVRVT